MSTSILLANVGTDLAQAATETAKTFGWNPHHFIAQVISFGIVALLLRRFAYQPILQALAKRRERIAESLANADKIKAELARTEAARLEALVQAGNQANQLIAEARVAAAKLLETESQKAIATAEQIIAKAREASEADHVRMMNELKREIGRLVVETTARVSGKILSVEDQRRLIEETNKQLAA
jgi:F-type H+-transporting ATPase subunit b